MAAPCVTLAIASRRCTFCNNLHSKLFHWSKYKRYVSTSKENPRSEPCEWQGVVGLEIHAQINTSSKLFSGASTKYGANTNSQVSHFDAALPGTLPVLNRGCVEAGVLTALALKSKINRVSMFDRKHYFYADLPAGYQITQYRKPLAVGGEVVYVYQSSVTNQVERRSAQLEQIQLEQDSGKSMHDGKEGVSLIDLNRAGTGLMEIVTKPDFDGGDAAASFVKELRDILMTINTCNGKMAEGSLRVDANISIHRPGQPLGVRTEVKNLNSLRSIRQAIESEIERQIDIVENGGAVENETRSFNVETGETVQMRDKEKILDYRFMPESNLPPLVLQTESRMPLSPSNSPQVVVEDVARKMPELPEETRLRLEKTYNLPLLHAMLLVREKLQDNFETLVNKYGCPPLVSSSVLQYFCKDFTFDDKSSEKEAILAEVVRLYGAGEISGRAISVLIEEGCKGGGQSIRVLAESLNLLVVSSHIIQEAMEEVLAKNPKVVKAYKRGKTNQLKILTSKIVRKLDGRASNETVLTMLTERLRD